MNTNKLFNNWIDKNFKGLSVVTLIQLLLMEVDFLTPLYVDNMICVELYEYFTGNHDDVHTKTYETCKMIVDNCTWL